MRRWFQTFLWFGDHNPAKIWYWCVFTCIKIDHNYVIYTRIDNE